LRIWEKVTRVEGEEEEEGEGEGEGAVVGGSAAREDRLSSIFSLHSPT